MPRNGKRTLDKWETPSRRLKMGLEYVVNFLNGGDPRSHLPEHSTLAARRRVTALLRDMQSLHSNLGDDERLQMHGELTEDVYGRIHDGMRRYPHPLSLRNDDYCDPRGCEAAAAAELSKVFSWPISHFDSQDDDWEKVPINLIKLCICGKWFAARSYNQKCCSGKRCRQNVYEKTDGAKERARQRGQKHYWRAKLREAVGLGNRDQIAEIKKKLASLEGGSHGSL